MTAAAPEGVNWELEEQANEILAEDRRASGDNSIASKKYILSPEQLEHRARHEVLIETFIREHPGIYHRAWNPLFGKRPKGMHSIAPEWDARVPHGTSAPTGWTADHWMNRSPAWAEPPRQNRYWHLTAGQRSRIRKYMRAMDRYPAAREAVKVLLAEKYGVPPWIITRVALCSSRCHT